MMMTKIKIAVAAALTVTAVSTAGVASYAVMENGKPVPPIPVEKQGRKSLSPVAAKSGEWPELQRDGMRSGYTPESADPPYKLKWKWNTDQKNLDSIS